MVNLSHDVRTPLTTLLGYLDAIHRGVVTGAERDACLEIARGKAYELKQTVDDLFTWSKLQAGEESLSLQDCDLAELTRQRLKDWVPLWEENRLDYELELPEQRVAVRLDPDAYGRVLNNRTLRLYDLTLPPDRLNRVLYENGLTILELHQCEDTLEDYFRQITGGEGIG